MAHTKGTWHMEGPQLVGNGYGIGHVTAHNTSEGKANAALIVAAPDLLEALVDAVSQIKSHLILLKCDMEFIDKQTAKASTAIASARGEA